MVPITDARLNRRELLSAGAVALAAAACGGSTTGSSAPSSSIPSSAKIESTLKFYNWAQYTNPDNIKAFSQKFGIDFVQTNYTSNEQLLSQLTSTKGQKLYDIIVPDADHVHIEKGLGLLRPLDHSLLPNLKYLDSHWSQLPYDPGNQFSVIKDTGITGFTLRTDTVKADLRSWKDFFDFLPQSGSLNVNFIESPSEIIGVALNSLGFSMNSQSATELAAAKKLLLSVRQYVDTINEVYLNDFMGGKIDLGVTYSGDGIRIRTGRSKQNDIKVVAPDGKSEIWIDNWCISADAPDPVAAHAWINFILDPANNAREMSYNAYEVGTPSSFPTVQPRELVTDPLVVFGDHILNDYEVLNTTPDGLAARVQIWDEFKAA